MKLWRQIKVRVALRDSVSIRSKGMDEQHETVTDEVHGSGGRAAW